MEVKADRNRVKALRCARAWSQQHLAEVADLSLRTVQRIERSGNGSPESLKSIAAAFEVATSEILVAPHEKQKPKVPTRRKLALGSLAAAFGALCYISFASAAPVMLAVNLSSGQESLAKVRLLNKAGKTSELRVGKLLKVVLLSKVTPDQHVRIAAKIYAEDANSGYVLIASPTVLAANRETAEVRFTGKGGRRFSLDITPDLGHESAKRVARTSGGR